MASTEKTDKDKSEVTALTDDNKPKAKFEDLFEHIGGLGRAQWLLYCSAAVFESTCFITMYYFIFEMASPGFQCIQTETDSNGSLIYGNVTDKCPKAPLTCTNLTFNKEYTTVKTEVRQNGCISSCY
jgi:hypothetical protein